MKPYSISPKSIKQRDLPMRLLRAVCCVVLCCASISCSTTKRLAQGEVLYTGVRHMRVESMNKGEKLPESVQASVKEALSVKPNNPLISPYIRTPIPTGLWAWNAFYTDRKTGFKAWIFRRLAKSPVLISQVRPESRTELVTDILDNHGSFGSSARYEIVPSRSGRKAKINYYVDVNTPWRYSNVAFPQCACNIGDEITTLQKSSNISVGRIYNIDSLSNERLRITDHLREKGYYYFRPDYIEYMADTTQQRLGVDLKMMLSAQTPQAAKQLYNIGSVDLVLLSNSGEGEFRDSLINGIGVRYQGELKLKPKVISAIISTTPGSVARSGVINQTARNLGRLGVFRAVNLEITPLDSLKNDTLDITIKATFDSPLEAEFEADLASKSNSFLGPGVILSIKNKNAFRGGEIFAIRLNGSYEWQTGNSNSVNHKIPVNSFEVGLNASITKPLITPSVVRRDKHLDSRMTFSVGANTLNRPRFFTLFSTDFSATYDFRTFEQNHHSITFLKLNYSKLIHTTEEFDSTMVHNQALALSFQNRLIPSIAYSYTLDRTYGRNMGNRIVWTSSFTEAGNVLAGIYGLLGSKGEKLLFGTAFSQYAKFTTEIRHLYRLDSRNIIASRFVIGAGHAYGNSKVMPFSEQFYSGGANSIRAFTVRTLGPGSYAPSGDYGFFDQTGDFRLEANVELRFALTKSLQGAVFLDAGNIWLLQKNPDKPGGALGESNFWRSIATGTGFGLRYDLSFLVVRADLGIGIHTPYPNPNKTGYYNIEKFRDGLGLHLAIGYPF